MEASILQTLSYFDIFNYPLTAWECYHWLYCPPAVVTWPEFEENLAALVVAGQVETKNGFYFLPGQEENIWVRQHRYLLAEQKYRVALRAIRWLRALPFIKYVGVCNTLAYNNAREDSDIDLFIITKAKGIWRARFLAALLMKLLAWRPTAQTTKNKICLSFFVSEENLNLQSIAIEDDIYLLYWLVQVVPIYDPAALQTKFFQANWSWVAKALPHSSSYLTNPVRVVRNTWLSLGIKKFLEFLFGCSAWEKALRRLQFALLPDNLKNIVNKDTRVIMQSNILKFHDSDRREEYRDKFKSKAQMTNVKSSQNVES